MNRAKEVIALGRERFVALRPDVQAACAAVTPSQADAVGVTLEELREVEVNRFLQLTAMALGEDVSEMLIKLGADGPLEAKRLIADSHAEMLKAIGAD